MANLQTFPSGHGGHPLHRLRRCCSLAPLLHCCTRSNQKIRAEAQLGAIFDELINSIGETKQAIWSASLSDRRLRLEALKAYLAEQAVLVDEAELRLGGRPRGLVSPTGHHPPNLAAQAAGNPDRVIDILVPHLETVEEDIRIRNASIEGEWHLLLGELADGLAARVAALKLS